ncbi:hypothetical protein [Tropicimonas sediminicola]|uniref:Uncharacterized protein n=1 Tax=Tropicimonas sediminicola TaxID=1031541 RepID=A0A239IXV4_9RHOB|nr:hypothetical protein [Tropicimonas sediminicola]SNS98355.1 hypothetical protein SAMN05421757_1052 [Tropicimonas sediminicola]
MTKVQPMDPEQRARIKILKDNFPDKDPWDGDVEFFLSKDFLLSTDLSRTVFLKEELEKLDRFAGAVTNVWNAYSSLSFRSRVALTQDLKTIATMPLQEELGFQAQPAREPEFERFRRNFLVEMIALFRAVHGRNPPAYENSPNASRDQGMINNAKSELQELHALNRHELNNERAAKVQFMSTARKVWKRYTGADAPKKGDSPFARFVNDLLIHIDKAESPGWSYEALANAWVSHERRTKSLSRGAKKES